MSLFRESLVGADGKGSSKNFTAFWLVVLLTVLHSIFMVIGYRIVDKVAPTAQSLEVMDRITQLISINWTVLLILFGLVSIQTILQALRIFKGQPEPVDPVIKETVEKTSKTVTVTSAPINPIENTEETKE